MEAKFIKGKWRNLINVKHDAFKAGVEAEYKVY